MNVQHNMLYSRSFLLPNFSLRNIQNVHMNASAYINDDDE